MTENHKARIDNIIRNGYDFKFGDYISQGFSLLQKDYGNFMLFALVAVIGIALIVIPIIGWFGVPLILIPVFTVGFYQAAHQLNRGEPIELNDLFCGFEKTKELALAVLVIGLFSLIAQIPYYLANSDLYFWYFDFFQDPLGGLDYLNIPSTKLWTYVLIIPSWLIRTLYTFTLPFIWFYDFKFWDAMEASRKIVSKKILLIIAFTFVVSLIGGVGIYICCVGILITYPAYMCMQYAAFADVTGLNREPDADDMIDQHLIVD